MYIKNLSVHRFKIEKFMDLNMEIHGLKNQYLRPKKFNQ